MSMPFVTVIIVCTMSSLVRVMRIPMILLVTISVVMTGFPVIVTAFMLQIGLAHGFVIVFVPVLVTVFMAMPMTVLFLVLAKISQVIFALLFAIMAVSVFADALISMTMLRQLMVPSILGFIRDSQRTSRGQKEQNKWNHQDFLHSWISLQSPLRS
jgi:hypothetical protein